MGRVVSPQHEHCLRNRCQRLRPGRGWGGSQREPRLLDCEPDLQELMRDLSRQHFGKERWDGVAQLPLRVSHGASDDSTGGSSNGKVQSRGPAAPAGSMMAGPSPA